MSAVLALFVGVAACSAMSGTLIAAHRGGGESEAPENTLPAFAHALEQGAQLIELDLRATADGAVVVHHDRSTARTLGAPGLIHQLTLAELQTLSTRRVTSVPTLPEVLRWAESRPVSLLLDIKPAPGLEPSAILQPVRRAGLSRRVLLGVRSSEAILAFRRLDAHLQFLGFVSRPEDIDDFVAAGAQAIRLWPRWIREQPDLVAQLRARAVGTWVTTGKADADALTELAGLGIEGVITDRPATAVQAIGCANPAVLGGAS